LGTGDLDPNVQRYIEYVTERNLATTAGSTYASADSILATVYSKDTEIYGYTIEASFPARDKSGRFVVIDVIGPDLNFFREADTDWVPFDG